MGVWATLWATGRAVRSSSERLSACMRGRSSGGRVDLVDQAYGRTAQQLEVRAAPLGDLDDVPIEELRARAEAMRAQLALEEKTG